MPGEKPQALLNTLQRLVNDIPAGSHSATAKDRSVLIALMGDIGAILSDTTTGIERTKEQNQQLRKWIPRLLGLAHPAAESMAATTELGARAPSARLKNRNESNRQMSNLHAQAFTTCGDKRMTCWVLRNHSGCFLADGTWRS